MTAAEQLVIHACPMDVCRAWRSDGHLFNNYHRHDYPQWHEVISCASLDALLLFTGMTPSKAQMKRLRRQNAIQIVESASAVKVRIGQRILLVYRPRIVDIPAKGDTIDEPGK